jgi:hypothetical protein
MPIHDWTQVGPGIFHHFHQTWAIEIANTLNAGTLPGGFYALIEQAIGGPIPDVITLQYGSGSSHSFGGQRGVALAEAPPRARYITSTEIDQYAAKANIISVRHQKGEVVAVIEIVSSGNKSSQYALRTFVEKSANLLRSGVNLLVIDLFPPTARDPQGIHKAIWDEICDEPFKLPEDKPLTIAAYMAGELKRAYVEPVGVGDILPSLPIFLDQRIYVPAPLEATYQSTWSKCPAPMRDLVEKRES